METIQLSDKTLRLGETVARITLGIDKLYRAELDDPKSDGLVVVNMSSLDAESYTDYSDAREAISQIVLAAFSLPEPDRRLYYAQALTSLDSFCVSRGKGQNQLNDTSEQIRLFLHVDPSPASDSTLHSYYHELYGLLGELGYSGDLKARCSAWEQNNIVPADEVRETMDELMREARERCGEIMDLPENDFYHCETESGVPYNARSDYDNRRVMINIDPTLTKPSLKHLVCHECYPGHFMQFTLRRVAWEKGYGAADGLLSVVNHSSSCTFEGIADAGIEFIRWTDNMDDKVNALLSTIKSALGTAASYRLNKLKQPDSEVRDFLRKNALVGGEGWVSNRMGFISNPARSALIWSYWRGDEGVFPIWRRVSPEDRARFFAYIYGRLHTIQSMRLFA
ncbi:hypothetical protein FACS18948_4860 [Clostridia bacterium]|nr:hypothetical protein FACS18948_4860 [Clostridia bacterium]